MSRILLFALLYFIFQGHHDAYAKKLKVPSNGYIICENSGNLKTLANMLNVGETSVANIYFKRLVLQKKCGQLRVGESITIIEGGLGSDIVRIIRKSNNRKYFMLSRKLEISSD